MSVPVEATYLMIKLFHSHCRPNPLCLMYARAMAARYLNQN